jgi:alkyl sulfatase BDS1-like metallo-beta-lactamase superfamily hydrolase
VATDLLGLADRLWNGEAAIENHLPFDPDQREPLLEVGDGVGFVATWANVAAFRTEDGLVLVDTGARPAARHVHGAVRAWSADPLHTAVYSHGHIDHVFGILAFDEEAAERGRPYPRVVAHEGVPERFDRYALMAGYYGIANRRQFVERVAGAKRPPALRWPTEFRRPDELYHDRTTLRVGGVAFELHHARGETDDHTWTWVPHRRVLCCGDLFGWGFPNAGNPQKVQRYAWEWAAALRTMADLEPETVLPGHGLPLIGTDRIRRAFEDTAELLESLHDQTLRLMNEGARQDDVVHTVRAPAHLMDRPYLHPIYDEPEFVVRGIWRRYGGWYDGNPAHLTPAPKAALGAEIVRLAGGPDAIRSRARALADDGDLRLAAHLAELAFAADPSDPASRALRAEVFERRAAAEPSLMARGVFASAALEARGIDASGGSRGGGLRGVARRLRRRGR